MQKIIVVGLLLIISTVSIAQEAPNTPEAPDQPEKESPTDEIDAQAVKNAEDFLASLDGINEGILGKTKYKLKHKGLQIGSMTIEIQKSRYNNKACYWLTRIMSFSVPGTSGKTIHNQYITDKLELLSSSDLEYKNDKLSESSTCALADGKYVKSWISDEEEVKTASFDKKPRQLIEDADVVATMLLPRGTPAKYSFTDWSKDFKHHQMEFEVGEKKKVGELEGISLIQREPYLKKDDKGRETPEVRTGDFLVSDAGKVLRIKASDMPISIELDTGRFDKEKIQELASPLDPVLCFWVGRRDNDVELLNLSTNLDKFIRNILKDEPDWKDATEDRLKKHVEYQKKIWAKNIVKEDVSGYVESLVNGLSTAWFDVVMDGENKAKVMFNEEFTKITGEAPELTWWVEKDPKTGKWKITNLESEEDDF